VSLRSALERTTHRIVVQRRLPAPFGGSRIYVTTEGGLRYLARTMARADPVLLRLAGEVVRPGSTVWDIGANVGLFSFAAAAAAGPGGRVLAIEPDTVMVGLLRRSATANRGGAPVEVLPAAVSDKVSVARLHIARRNRATNHLDGFGSTEAGGVRSTQTVMTVTLDWLAARFPAPDVIKIDVEQAEGAVLAGGPGVLALAPIIICEVAAPNSGPVSEILNARGYTVFDGDLPERDRVPTTTAPFNTLAIAELSATPRDAQSFTARVSLLYAPGMAAADVIGAKSDIKVNVGCGATPTPGWVNFDNSLSVRLARHPALSAALARLRVIGSQSAYLAEITRQEKVHFANAAARIPCAGGSASVVYSSHMIEHLDRAEARKFLAEVKRVLRPGGIARLAAPDLSRLARAYLASGDADEFVAGIHMGLDRPAGLRAWAKWTLVGPRHHLWMYDGDSLVRLLHEAGFEDAATEPPGVTRIADPGVLDLRERAAESVYVEAVRP
jgi:FkbM family methyltransferase